MSKKNKGGKTPSAKAARNLEALKKAKEAAIAAEVKEQKVENPPVEEKKEEKPEPKPTPTPKKTAYESYLEYGKHPHMMMVSQTIKKNDKGVEIITTEWKNTENGETASTAFSASFVKKGDGIDLKKLREQAEKGLKTYYAEKKEESKAPEKPVSKQTDPLPADPIPEPKKEEKKEEKKPTAKKAKKEEVIIPEEVKDPKPVAKPMTKPIIQTPADRIDANHGIELMKSFENRAAELEKGTELHRAMREQADLMLFVYGKQWLDQCTADGDEAFARVSRKNYERLSLIGHELLGITVKALPVPGSDGQMEIDFKETLETAPAKIKEAIDADAKKETPSNVIPDANPSATEEDKIKALDSILRMKNGMDGNLINAINFAKGSFPELKDAVPAQVIAFIYSKIEHSTLLAAYANAVMGNLCGNGNIFSAHTWLKARLASHDFNDIEIAQMAKVMLANGLNNRKEGDYTTTSAACNKLLKQMNDDLINRIINAKTPKDEAKLKISGKFTELGGVQTAIPATKIINSMKLAYGTEQSSKLLKQNMQRIMGLYSDGIKPLEVYVEKSTYVTKK